MIHEHFCYNRRSAVSTSLRPAGSPVESSTYCTSTPRVLRAPRAALTTRLGDFATNRHESCGLARCIRYFHLTFLHRPLEYLHSGGNMQQVSSRTRWSDEQDSQERADDGYGNLPLAQNSTAETLSASSAPRHPRVQARQRVAIRPFGSRTVDPRHPTQVFGQFLS
jgi:hypothetical protein